jgi:signal transduction histidine kinase
VNADASRVLQVLSNLVGNAIKFTPAGGRIVVGAKRVGEKVLCSVTDTGPGIPTDKLPHIFDRFWQANHADRRGIGLGLAIAKGIVEAHGEQIWVVSEVGGGSTFLFALPLNEVSMAAQPARPAAVHTGV